MKKQLSLLLAFSFVSASAVSLSACGDKTPVLRIASWEEYIDEGGEDGYIEGRICGIMTVNSARVGVAPRSSAAS